MKNKDKFLYEQIENKLTDISIDISIIGTVLNYVAKEINEIEGYDTDIGNSIFLLQKLVRTTKNKIKTCGNEYCKFIKKSYYN